MGPDLGVRAFDARLPHPLMRHSFLIGDGLPSLPRTHPLACEPAAKQVLLLVIGDGCQKDRRLLERPHAPDGLGREAAPKVMKDDAADRETTTAQLPDR